MNRPFESLSWMWSEALAALEDAERRHRKFFALVGGNTPPAWEPPADVYETNEGLIIVVALPGVASDQVYVFVDSNGLLVQSKRLPCARECVHIRRLEIPYGTFERRFDLPAGRYTLREQRMANGCLELHLTRE